MTQINKHKITLYLLLLLVSLLSAVITLGQEKPEVQFGGALRFNYNLSSWKEGQKARGGDFGYDLFRINSIAAYKGVKLNAEYRLYSQAFGGGMLKQGWIGYDFTPERNLQIGLTQVPFGITQYNSNNWFFNMTYYVGLEDDHDMGIKYTYTGERWDFALAFFKNAEELIFGSYSDVSDSRYSYDVSSIDLDGDGLPDLRNKETNQVNGKLVRKFQNGQFIHMLGMSGQYGGLYNLDTGETGSHHAYAVHYEMQAGRIIVEAQLAGYGHNPENQPEETDDAVAMTAYGAPYLVAADGIVYTLNLSWSLPVDWNPVSNLQFYNDFGYLSKASPDYNDSYMNVTGVLVTAGSVYTYIDAAAGKNHSWLGPEWMNALAEGTENASWHVRFNINLGYYF
ncbi:MAG: hypothetical protein ACOC0R_01540 [Mariniphaga sp.]